MKAVAATSLYVPYILGKAKSKAGFTLALCCQVVVCEDKELCTLQGLFKTCGEIIYKIVSMKSQ